MEKATILKKLSELKQQYPAITMIYVEYYGSGDEFGEFNAYEVKDKNDNPIELPENFIEEINDVLWHMLESGDVRFDFEGAEGEITIDLESMSINLQNYYCYMERSPGAQVSLDLLNN